MCRKADTYSNLVNNHIKTILESGLLLDEDYEVLLNSTTFKITPSKVRLPKFVVYGTSFATSFLLFKWYKPLLVVPAVGIGVYLWKERRRKVEEEIVGQVVGEFVKLRRFNVSVLRYLKVRQGMDDNEQVNDFLEVYLKKWREFLEVLLKEIAGLADDNQKLREDFVVFDHLDIEGINTINLMADVFTLLFSKYLSYVGLTFNELNPFNLLNTKLPLIKNLAAKLYIFLHKEFNNAKYSSVKKLQIERKKVVSGKLQETLDGAVNNLSVILEKSRGVLEKMDTERNVEVLRELTGHAKSTYENLEVLCKIYGILSQPIEPPTIVAPPVSTTSSKTINYDDPLVEKEENYELYIPDSPHSSPPPTPPIQDMSSQYLSLMLQELQQSLSKHERFIDARTKRGVTEEKPVRQPPKPVPRFRLNPLVPSAPQGPPPPPPPPSLLSLQLEEGQRPPPPPPLPPLSLPENEKEGKGLLEGIKMLSSQLQGEEEIFM